MELSIPLKEGLQEQQNLEGLSQYNDVFLPV